MACLKKACVQIYTGNGKGKTTAATGLAIRAAGAGLSVLIYRFMKGRATSEDAVLCKIKNISVRSCGRNTFITDTPRESDRTCAARGIEEVKTYLARALFDIIILDEINVAMDMGLVCKHDVIHIITHKPDRVELILTGRNCPRAIYRYADLVSDIRDVRHPYRAGIKARRGIDH